MRDPSKSLFAVWMKLPLQERLRSVSKDLGVPMSRIIGESIERNLPKYEQAAVLVREQEK